MDYHFLEQQDNNKIQRYIFNAYYFKCTQIVFKFDFNFQPLIDEQPKIRKLYFERPGEIPPTIETLNRFTDMCSALNFNFATSETIRLHSAHAKTFYAM